MEKMPQVASSHRGDLYQKKQSACHNPPSLGVRHYYNSLILKYFKWAFLGRGYKNPWKYRKLGKFGEKWGGETPTLLYECQLLKKTPDAADEVPSDTGSAVKKIVADIHHSLDSIRG